MRAVSIFVLAAFVLACGGRATAFSPSAHRVRPGLRMPAPAGPVRRVHPSVLASRSRAARATFLSSLRASEGEEPLVAPPKEMAGAYVDSMDQYEKMYKESLEDPEKFWSKIADDFHWEKRWDKLNEVNFDNTKGPVSVKWFLGAKTNLAYNALDRHVLAGKGDTVAFYWEGNEPDESISYTYAELLDKVQRFDNVAIYLPMVAELPIAMLACARIGAVHSVVFGGFSAEALASRIIDSKAKVLVTADGTMRGKKLIDLLNIADNALGLVDKSGEHKVSSTIVVERKPNADAPKLQDGKHESFGALVAAADSACPIEWYATINNMDSGAQQ
jgi:acetyl-CoA synthetase